jgi:hypothetical protein
MKRYGKQCFQWGLTILFGLAVFLFWRLKYPYVLSYQEQFQLFIGSGAYFSSALAVPGGLACYLSEWLVQLYISFTAGAVVIAVSLALTQRLTWAVFNKVCRCGCHTPDAYYPLSFLPSILLWVLMGDESVLLAYIVSLVICLTAMLLWPRKVIMQIVACLVAIPCIYWVAGPMVIAVALFVALLNFFTPKRQNDQTSKRPNSQTPKLLNALLVLLWAVTCILISAQFVPFPLDRLFAGIGYYRLLTVQPVLMLIVPLLCVLLPFVVSFLPAFHDNMKWRNSLFIMQTGAMALIACLALPRAYEPRKYELMEYDHLVRTKQWDAILAKAEQKRPDLPMSVCATNLALAMKGQLCDRIFDFYQHGHEGLLPNFQRHFTADQLTGEVMFYLGLVNTSQRLAMESMESLPDQRKSVRAVKRLAETNLVNGHYEVARKYLGFLKQTLFYKEWAEQTEALLGKEDKINAHPLYGWLRKIRLDEDFLYSEEEKDKICGQLFMKNQDNMMAVQYLLMMPLLDKDINRFMQYTQLVNEKLEFRPRAVQEAIAFAYMQANRQMPQGTVSPVVLQNLQGFMQAYNQGAQSPALQNYSNTVWYYLLKK